MAQERRYDQTVRYPNVLFDLDGTLIDSGAIILASFKHATRTVLRREIPDAELAACVGGSNIYDQMRAIDELQAEELVRVYREHNEPLHDELEAFEGVEHVLAELKRQRRRLGIVTAKRRKTVELAFAVLPLEPYFDAVVTFSREPIGVRCSTLRNLSDGGAPTRCVGESGVARSGFSSSSRFSSSKRRSYSASEISGSSRTW